MVCPCPSTTTATQLPEEETSKGQLDKKMFIKSLRGQNEEVSIIIFFFYLETNLSQHGSKEMEMRCKFFV